jgi:hypothetical protein
MAEISKHRQRTTGWLVVVVGIALVIANAEGLINLDEMFRSFGR